jgi:phosphotriesterase-related protein
MGGFVRTLTGDVKPEALGATLIHEHLTVDWGEMLGRPKHLEFDRGELVERIVGKLKALAAVGIGAMTECTPFGCGRYVDLFAEVARRAPVRIIGSTGFFHESWCPIHPVARALDLDALTDLITREITEGMGDTLIRAGLIKVATGEGRISETEQKILRAAARARRATGCPIITHITSSMSLEQLDVFESEGVAPEEVVISHVGFAADPLEEAEALLRRGANISFDRIGYRVFFGDEHWIGLIRHALAKGYVGQVMLSHDAATMAYGLEMASGEDLWDDYTYISRVFLPRLRSDAGVTDQQIHTMLVENPQRVLAFA